MKSRIIKVVMLYTTLLCSIAASATDYRIEEVKFNSHGNTLSGSLVLPQTENILAAVVFVHGSGKQTRNLHWAKRFASEGIAALVYDKRGVGRSGGVYEGDQSVSEKNIKLLADDATAAMTILQRHAATKNLLHGLTGISQAGWIIPLAAENSNAVDFMVLWSGPVCKVSEEDIFSKYTADSDSHKIPSYEHVLKSRKEKYYWPKFLGADSDPSESLARLNIPGLWIFGANDGSIPVDLSMQRLEAQIEDGRKYQYILFSGLGHNNMEETFATASHWIKRLHQRLQ